MNKRLCRLLMGMSLVAMTVGCVPPNPPQMEAEPTPETAQELAESLMGAGIASKMTAYDRQESDGHGGMSRGISRPQAGPMHESLGEDQRLMRQVAEEEGYEPRYVTIGGHRALVLVEPDRSWDQNTTETKNAELQEAYQLAFPRYEVIVREADA